MTATRKEQATAYHEAGHAVARFLLGRSPGIVSIIADDDALGFNLHRPLFRWKKLIDSRKITAGRRRRLSARETREAILAGAGGRWPS